ncbi:MAG: hypothetical protein N3E51_01550 [Candidatus Micrarchaeota archaeon]|nr:hypothetical protein [Candidatus Micrarchaeota archaeon]
MRRLFLIAILAFAFGCVAQQPQTAPQAKQEVQESSFSVPPSPLKYTATYEVIDDGAESQKRVFRMDRMMRVDIGVGQSSVSAYLLGNRAYSCSESGGKAACFDITSRVQNGQLDWLFEIPSLSDAVEVEGVRIGSGEGRCYLFFYPPQMTRMLCLTDRGVIAYDEYNVSSRQKHVEYLVEIAYEAHPSDFELPASPLPLPPYSSTQAR